MDQQIKPIDTVTSEDIHLAWLESGEAHPWKHILRVAELFRLSPAEVVASGCGSNVTRLCGDWRDLFLSMVRGRSLEMTVGWGDCVMHSVMSLETLSVLDNKIWLDEGDSGLEIEARRIQTGFAVWGTGGNDARDAFWFFDIEGAPVLMIYAVGGDQQLYRSLRTRFIHPIQTPSQTVLRTVSRVSTAAVLPLDADPMKLNWATLRYWKEISGLIHRYGISYDTALKTLGPPLAREVAPDSLRLLLEVGEDQMLPLWVSLLGAGAAITWAGDVIVASGENHSINGSGRQMQLSMDAQELDRAWLVELPGADLPPMVEFFDGRGRHILSLSVPPQSTSRDNRVWRDTLEALVSSEWL